MSRLGGSLLVAALVVAALSTPAAAQPEELELVSVQRAGRDVSVTVVAPPALRGDAVDNATFTVDVGGTPVAPSIEKVEGDDLDVVLLVDVSGSMTPEALAAAKQAGAAFVTSLPSNTRIALVSFGDEATVVQQFTSDLDAVIAELDRLEAAGETALYAAVIEAARQFAPTSDSIRAVVLLSDGGNTIDDGTLGQAQAALVQSRATLHAISIETGESNPAELDALAAASGGTVARVEQIEEIEALYSSIAADLGSQYRIRFSAPGNGPTLARIRIISDGVVLAESSFQLALPAAAAPAPPAPAPAPVPTTAPAPIQATPPTVEVVDAGSNAVLKWGAIVALAGSIAIAAMLLLAPAEGGRRRPRRAPVQQFARQTEPASNRVVSGIVAVMTGFVDRWLRGRRAGAWLSNILDTAGWKVRNSEFIVLIGFSTVAAFFAGAIASLAFGTALALLVLLGVGLVLGLLVKKRRDAFAEQLNGTLQMMAGGLRTGYSLPQVISIVAQEASEPTSEEFSRIVVESRLGRDLVESAHAVAARMKNEDMAWATAAIEITREIGGDLAEVLDNVAETIRTRARVRRQILALSAEGRVSAYILIGLPFPIFFWQLLVNRDYTTLLFSDSLGRSILIAAIAALVAGAIWMRRLIQVKY